MHHLAASGVLAFGLTRVALSAAELAVQPAQDRVEILGDGRPLATFVFRDPQILRPYFANLVTGDGIQVTRRHPPRAGVDADDHATMHPGVWLAFGDVNGEDFWRNKGRIEHRRFSEAPVVRDGRLRFGTECRLIGTGGELGLLTNRCELRPVGWGWLLVWEATVSSDTVDLVFGDQEEMGFGARVATALAERNGGMMVSSAGLVTAKGTWGQAADWCDYYGRVGERRAGLTLMADPANFRPSWWHNRDYGLMVANPFGREAMRQGGKSAVVVRRGETLRLRFGAFVHSAGMDEAPGIAEVYRAFADGAWPEND